MLRNVEQIYISFTLLWKLLGKGFLRLSPITIPNTGRLKYTQLLTVMFDDDDDDGMSLCTLEKWSSNWLLGSYIPGECLQLPEEFPSQYSLGQKC